MTTAARTASYVYGVVPADVGLGRDVVGLGDPPEPVGLVQHGTVAALVSALPVPRRPLGEPADLTTHASVLDAVAAATPVLPLRFGVVVDGASDVLGGWLAEHHDAFADALLELRGRAEYQLTGRYDERAVLTEVLAECRDAARLRDAVRDRPPHAVWRERVALGELVANAVATKRAEDTRRVVEALRPLGGLLSPREPTHEHDAVHVAVLLDTAREGELERVADGLARAWAGRVRLRLVGPLAPYDFVAVEG